MSDFAVATVQDLVTDAMLLCLAQTPGEPIPAAEMFFGVRELNRLMGKYSIIRNFCFTSNLATYTFATVKNTYTIGPDNTSFHPDFQGPRPTRVIQANIIITGQPQPVYIPCEVIDAEQWMSLSIRQIPTAIPRKVYYDNGYTSVGAPGGQPNLGYGTLYFYGQPQAGYQVELLVPQVLPSYAALAGTGGYFTFPPAYEEFVVTTLAEMLSISYGRPIPPDLALRARKARAAIVSLNSKAPVANTDVPGSDKGGGYFNWLSREVI
jgi:hypothetical protein